MSTLLYLTYFFGAVIFTAIIPLALLTFRWELHRAEIFYYSPDWNLYSVLYLVMCLMFQFTGFSFVVLLIVNKT